MRSRLAMADGSAVGFLCLAACFFVLSYYGVIAGWTIGYIYSSVTQAGMEFESFAANPNWVIPLFAVFIVATIYIVQAGIEKGIEKWSKILITVATTEVGGNTIGYTWSVNIKRFVRSLDGKHNIKIAPTWFLDGGSVGDSAKLKEAIEIALDKVFLAYLELKE